MRHRSHSTHSTLCNQWSIVNCAIQIHTPFSKPSISGAGCQYVDMTTAGDCSLLSQPKYNVDEWRGRVCGCRPGLRVSRAGAAHNPGLWRAGPWALGTGQRPLLARIRRSPVTVQSLAMVWSRCYHSRRLRLCLCFSVSVSRLLHQNIFWKDCQNIFWKACLVLGVIVSFISW